MKDICNTLEKIKDNLVSIDCGLGVIQSKMVVSEDVAKNAEEVARSARLIAWRAEVTAAEARRKPARFAVSA